MVLLLLTYLLKKIGHKLKLKALLQKPQYSMALQTVKVQNIPEDLLLKSSDF
jgi:hypothetical protein